MINYNTKNKKYKVKIRKILFFTSAYKMKKI